MNSEGEATMRILILGAAALGLCACTTATVPTQRSAKAQATYDRLLAGKVAGSAERCLPTYNSEDMTVIDENTILFRNGRTVYVNQPLGGCSQADRIGSSLVTRLHGAAQLCRGDIATVVDHSTGAMMGSCAFGDFVPYRPTTG